MLWAGFSMVPAPRTTDLLSDLPERLVNLLLANAKPVKLAADGILFFAGDPGDGCYRLDEGLVKVSMVSPKGAERILAILGPGSIVGDMAMVDGRPRYNWAISSGLNGGPPAGVFRPQRL